MFARAKPYLILQAVTAIPFTVLIISPESQLTIAGRWLGGLLLWMQIVNWSALLEARKWACVAELARLFVTTAFLAWFFPAVERSIYGFGALLFILVSLFWVTAYFRPNSRTAPAPV